VLGELDLTGRSLSTTTLVTAADAGVRQVLDVRQDTEWQAGHLPGAVHVELGSLDAVRGPVAVMCGHGERAMSGASVLERAGVDDVAVVLGGPEDWARAHDIPLATGG
jgi:hydroxyacylglutathione hydrolase